MEISCTVVVGFDYVEISDDWFKQIIAFVHILYIYILWFNVIGAYCLSSLQMAV